MTELEMDNAYRRTLGNRKEIAKSSMCGCISCRTIFAAAEVVDFIDAGQTALCPCCGVDAVIGDAAGVKLTAELLAAMNKKYFE